MKLIIILLLNIISVRVNCDSCHFTDDEILEESSQSNDVKQNSNNNNNNNDALLRHVHRYHEHHQQHELNQQMESYRECSYLCPGLTFRATCKCHLIGSDNARLECSRTNASILVSDIEQLNSCEIGLAELIVRNSNLTRLYHLPSGLYNVEELILDNTGIDLETLRESNELLRRLKILRISSENFTEIPETLFSGIDELRELSLNNLGMAYINGDAFVPLQDSLEILELRSNQLRTIPNAVQILSKLECLDLRDNDIKSTLADANALIALKRLKRLRIDLSKCSCEFGKTRFATWLRTYAIKGVTCPEAHHSAHAQLSEHQFQQQHQQNKHSFSSSGPNSVPESYALRQNPKTSISIYRDVSNSPVEDFCEPSFNSNPPSTKTSTSGLTLIFFFFTVYFLF